MYKRLVIKIGTRVITKEDGILNELILDRLVHQIAGLKREGIEVVLVTSGAVGSGRGLLKRKNNTETIESKQIFAAVGQVKLMETYSNLFLKNGFFCAQILVTKEDFRDVGHYRNMRQCFLNLLNYGIIPIVNENDVVAIKELVFTDNDELAGLVASQLKADALIILSSIPGVIAGELSSSAPKIIKEINFNDISLAEKNIKNEKTIVGRGGMVTKFKIAKKLMSLGIAVYIADGAKENILSDIISGSGIYTKFNPLKKTSGIKMRLANSGGFASGAIFVNKCTHDLLVLRERVMSLLPVGIIRVTGKFKKGDVVEIIGVKNKKIGVGIAFMDSDKIKSLSGKKGSKPAVHYDYMFIE